MYDPSETARLREIDAAFGSGNLAALKAALKEPEAVPNGPMPATVGNCLVYAIYHSPLAFVRELLELGADPNADPHDGFPPLIAALWMPYRSDTNDLVRLLLSHGADPNQRGHNDYGALHVAVSENNLEAADLLLDAGADLRQRTRIDDLETPVELAEREGSEAMRALLERWEARLAGRMDGAGPGGGA